jgi:hypothetical protein
MTQNIVQSIAVLAEITINCFSDFVPVLLFPNYRDLQREFILNAK